MKRTLSIEEFDSAKRHCSYPSFSVTSTYNYLTDNCLSDYLNKFGDKSKISTVQDISFFRGQGILFEQEVVRYLSSKYPLLSLSSQYSEENLEISKRYLLKEVPILHSVCLKRRIHGCVIYGVADLIMKGRYILELSSETERFLPIDVDKYYVVDIKFSTLPLSANGIDLQNIEKFKAYKTQVWLYSKMLKPILGYTPECGFLMGRRWKFIKCGVTHHGFRCDERLGKIDFSTQVVQDSYDALDWLKRLEREGEDWQEDPPSVPELYPNIYAKDKWTKYQNELARKNSDLLLLWNCKKFHRTLAHDKGIYSFQNDNCCSKNLAIVGRTDIIDTMIRLNKHGCEILFECGITPELSELKERAVLYVDFETLLDVKLGGDQMPISPETKMITIIGVGYEKEGEWNFRSFVADSFGIEEEKRIMQEFSTFVQTFENPILVHWTPAEVREWKHAQERVGVIFYPLNFFDLHKLFIDSKIVIRGAFSYSLKDVCKALNNLRLIDFRWSSECCDGLGAALTLFKYYVQKIEIDITDIIKYNEFDCLALKKIVDFIKNIS